MMGTMEPKLTFMAQSIRLIRLRAALKHYMITISHAPFVWFAKGLLFRCFQASMNKSNWVFKDLLAISTF